LHSTRSFRARLRLLALAAAAVLVLAACAPGPAGNPNAAAVVDGEDIPVAEVERRFETVAENPQIAPQLEADEDGAFEQQVQAQILSQLIQSRLLRQGAGELGVEVTDADVEEQRAAIVEQVGGEEAFAEIVEQNNLTEDEIDDQLRDLAYQEQVQEALTADVEVSDEEVAEFYEQNADSRYGEVASARHILVESEEEAEEALERVEEGEEFASVAEDVSTDTASAEQGGDLGEFTRDRMVPEFADAVFGAEPGELVGPVETQFGYHVIEVTERSEGPALEDVSDDIREELRQQREQEAVQAWLAERNREADVEVNPRFGEWDPETGQVVVDEPLGEAPAEPAPAPPAGEAPADDAPAGEAPADDAPVGDAPADDAPVGDAPAGDAPAADDPAADEAS
jgi:foldase protein PrsA